MKDKKLDKQIKISSDRHQKLKEMAVKENKEMREIIGEAFDLYMKHKKECKDD